MNLHAINWFEIPVIDFDRAKRFYETIYAYQMPEVQMGPARMGFLLYDVQSGGRGGAIVHNPEFYTPSKNGTLIYLNGDPDLQTILDRIEGAGGKVTMAKTEISQDLGFWATFEDTEGNRLALHSMD